MEKPGKKRRCVFTKYEFEIGVVTLPAHVVILAAGIIFWQLTIGKIAAITGFFGTLAAINSMVHGAKEVEF